MEQIMVVILCAFTRTMLIVEGAVDEKEVCLRAKPHGVLRTYWDCEAPR